MRADLHIPIADKVTQRERAAGQAHVLGGHSSLKPSEQCLVLQALSHQLCKWARRGKSGEWQREKSS